MLSRTDWISDKKVDLPSAWRERDNGSYVVFFVCLALLTVFGMTQCVSEMCYTQTDEMTAIGDDDRQRRYILSLCPVLKCARGSICTSRADILAVYGLYPNASSVLNQGECVEI